MKGEIKTRVIIKLRENQTVEQVDEFTYLDNAISNDGRKKKKGINRVCQVEKSCNYKKTLYSHRIT